MADNTDDVLDNWEDEDADVSSKMLKNARKFASGPMIFATTSVFLSKVARVVRCVGVITQVLERRMEERQRLEKQKQQKKEK